MLAKERIHLKTLLNRPPTTVTDPSEPVFEEPVEQHTQATERDRKIRKSKLTWQNRCKKIDDIGIMCGDKLWEHCEQKASSVLCLCIGTEGLRIFKSKHPHFIIEKQSMKEIWRVIKDSFIKTRNINHERFVLFSSKQKKGESVESFYGRLKEQLENCSLGEKEISLIRDNFILNIRDYDTRKELLKETVSSTKALEIAIHMEMGAQNQQKTNQNLNTNAQSVKTVSNYQGRNQTTNYKQQRKDLTRYSTALQNYQYTSIFDNCGQLLSHNHRQICPANGKKRKNCGIMGRFAKKCRKPKNSQAPFSKSQPTNVDHIDTTTTTFQRKKEQNGRLCKTAGKAFLLKLNK